MGSAGRMGSAMPNLQIELLGHFFLRYDGEPLARLHQARQQELLAYLVLHRRAPQARRHLAFLFWPDSTESQARTNLRQLLHDLRRALPAAGTFLQMDAQSVRWQPRMPPLPSMRPILSARLQRQAIPPPIALSWSGRS